MSRTISRDQARKAGEELAAIIRDRREKQIAEAREKEERERLQFQQREERRAK